MTNNSEGPFGGRPEVSAQETKPHNNRGFFFCCNLSRICNFKKRRADRTESVSSKVDFQIDADIGHAVYFPGKREDELVASLQSSERNIQCTADTVGKPSW